MDKKKEPKTILTKRGYAIVKSKFTEEELNSIKKDLTVTPFSPSDFGPPPASFPIFLESPLKLYLPKHYAFEKLGEPDQVKLSEGLNIDIPFNGSLRPQQIEVIEKFMKSCEKPIDGKTNYSKKSRGGLICVGCGFGKTVMGLNLISLLKKKTLVIVHKEFLVNQWKKRIEEYLPTAKVGTIQGPIIDYKDKDIVIGMLQSVSMKEYPDEVFNEFGFAIIDECHHIAAEVFSRALPKINSMYQLGLSATPKRSDGLSKVFHSFLGPIIYEAKKTNNTNVQVMAVHYHNNWDPGYNKEETMGFGKVCPVKMISNIVIYDRRNALIARIVMKLVLEGRKTLILSERRDHLTAIEGLIKDFTTVGYYVGGMKQKDLDKSEDMQVLLATYQMASEGMDIPSLDSVIFATPKSSIEQSIGRITRKVHENPPIAYDIVDEFSIFPNQFKKRKAVYSKLKYKITHLHIKDHIHTTLEQLTNQIEAEVLTEEQMEELIEKEIKKEEEKFKICLLDD